ncbi:hypothetical protein [Sphingomonas sp. Leaf23]|nr:hypothetical protein [Sphingomonas sp. Leaf23]
MILSTKVAKATTSIATPMMTIAESLLVFLTSSAVDVSTARLV